MLLIFVHTWHYLYLKYLRINVSFRFIGDDICKNVASIFTMQIFFGFMYQLKLELVL